MKKTIEGIEIVYEPQEGIVETWGMVETVEIKSKIEMLLSEVDDFMNNNTTLSPSKISARVMPVAISIASNIKELLYFITMINLKIGRDMTSKFEPVKKPIQVIQVPNFSELLDAHNQDAIELQSYIRQMESCIKIKNLIESQIIRISKKLSTPKTPSDGKQA